MRNLRPTRLVSDLRQLQERIESTLGPGNGSQNGLRRRVYLELLGVLNGTSRFDEIPSAIPNTSGLTERIYRRLATERDFALPRAVYAATQYRVSPDSFINRGDVHRSEWDYLSKLARTLHVPPSVGYDSLDEQPPWMIDIDESHQELRVWIRELALQDLLLAGMEAFLVPAGSGKPSTEIYGIVFGSYRRTERPRTRGGVSLLDLNVERVCIQHRAKCSPTEVFADIRSEHTQLAMAEELFPYWHLLGDFHTHTYRSLRELYKRGGWGYSDADEAFNIEWCRRLRASGHRPRVALILAITRAGRASNASEESWNGLPHVLRTTIGRCHCFISAYRIRPDGRYTTEGLSLRCPHLAGK